MGFGRQTYSVEQALAKMQYYCAYQERCHHEIRQKLISMHMIPQAIDQITVVLINEGYLNEERFTRTFISGKFRIKKWGKNRLKQELKKRQISNYLIEKGIAEINPQEYLETFNQLADDKIASLKTKSPKLSKKKLIDFLLYRGWEYNLIFDKLKTIDS